MNQLPRCLVLSLLTIGLLFTTSACSGCYTYEVESPVCTEKLSHETFSPAGGRARTTVETCSYKSGKKPAEFSTMVRLDNVPGEQRSLFGPDSHVFDGVGIFRGDFLGKASPPDITVEWRSASDLLITYPRRTGFYCKQASAIKVHCLERNFAQVR